MAVDELIGGYRQPYNPRPALERLIQGSETALVELWENLHHQGDVDTASYFSVPALVAAGQLSLVACIEVARHNLNNPKIPESLASRYEQALAQALQTQPKDEEQCLGYYAIHASMAGYSNLAKALMVMNPAEVLKEYG